MVFVKTVLPSQKKLCVNVCEDCVTLGKSFLEDTMLFQWGLLANREVMQRRLFLVVACPVCVDGNFVFL